MKRFLRSPVFVLLIAMVILNILEGDFSNMGDLIMSKLLMLPAIIIGLSFHEFAHAAVSNALGDPTPKAQGRVTINPLAHIDPFGFVALFIAGFGWGQPVQIDPRYYKNRRVGEILVAFAGVTMNLLLAVVFAFVIKAFLAFAPSMGSEFIAQIILEMLVDVVLINIVLMVFNLLPVPPLDGFGIVTQIFKLERYDWYYKIYDKGFLILLILILFNVTDLVLQPCVSFVYSAIMGLIL
ncbi:MAG: site-2 protease family protein [Emergencia sp.]